MTTEQKRREQFLSSRGAPSRQETREKFLQREEIQGRIDWLQDHVKRFSEATDTVGVALRKAWQRELAEKRGLIVDLIEGRKVTRAQIAQGVNSVLVAQKANQQAQRERAMIQTR